MLISMITCNTYISMPHSCSPVRSIESLGSCCSCHWRSPWSECHTYLCQSQIQSRHLCSWKTHNLLIYYNLLNTVSGMRRRSRRSHSFDLYLCSYKLAIVSSYFAILHLFLTILTFFSELQETKYELWHTLSVLQEKFNNYEKQSSILFIFLFGGRNGLS